ncbi:type IV secretion system protein VirB10 [Phyllobacterium sp. YR620]|uniref:type IV secretion system protein VirB10 n=1 Tax=Phyllobacterium sp. YR620 TaxID=1881066 RepID=UPI0008876B85|nr:type IV secretion system protein VirB10 [Phyllobacterium sp. YR620]SDP91790.1 type IV secretion system protein VirB10 [Phyllobacterium sp. YR620]
MPDPNYHQNVELEESAQSQLSEPKRGLSKAAIVVLFGMVSIPLLAMPFWLAQPKAPDNVESNENEEFLAPPGKVQLNVPPPEPEAPATAPTQPTGGSATDAELERAKQAAEEEARRLAEERKALEAERLARDSENDQKRWERYRSPMVVTETGGQVDPLAQAGKTPEQAEKEKSAATFQDANPNNQFLSALAAKPVEVATAEQTKRIDALVPQGTMIRGVLETAVQTDLPGMVRAVTTEDVWSFDGRRVLIPSGSRMIGEYNAGVAQGQTRAFIVWNRLLRADGVSLNLGSIGTDELGVSGAAGAVNNHYLKRFGAAGVLSLISAGSQIMAATSVPTNDVGYTIKSIPDPSDPTKSITIQTPTTNKVALNDMAMQGAALAVQNFTQLAQEAIKSQINIPPTISINQGTPVAIFVRRDLDFSELYPDPVQEKLKELKRGRGWDGKY